MTPDAPANGTGNSASHLQLAALLRECANIVERNEFHPDMYQVLGQLQAYTGQHSSGDEHRQVSTTTPKASTTMDPIHVMNSLGKGLKKGLGLEPQHKARVNPGAAQATSSKNAERARSDLGDLARKVERGHRSTENDWCDEHFCLGCACKDHLKTSASSLSSTTDLSSSRSRSPVRDPSRVPDTSRVNVTTTTTTSRQAKPSFQRPVNPNSILIANGWIEQQRRSKMRVVWKDVLASLVEGRKPGEETTLWIQRETTNHLTGKPELEALHQIPMKWLVSIEYLDYSTDHRFALKVHNVQEEFLFKCADEDSAQNWVLTLRSVREIALKDTKSPKSEVEEKGETTLPSREQIEAPSREPEPNSHRMAIHELRAIAHGAGINTAGMERKELEAAVAIIAGSAQSDTAKEDQRRDEELRRKQEMEAELRRRQAAADAEEAEQRRHTTEENRRIAVEENERRMKIAEEEEHRIRLEQEHHRRQLAEEEQRRQQLSEEEHHRRQLAEEEQRRRKLVEEEQRRRQQQQAEEELRRRKQAEDAQRIEEMRRRKLAEEEQRRRATEEEQRRRAAEQQAAEQRRRQEETQRQQWQQQQRQQAAEQQAVEQRRRQEEAQRQQQWKEQQQRQQQQQQWQQRRPPPQQPTPQNWQQQQRPTPQQQPFGGGVGGARAASPPGQAPPAPQRGQGPTSSPVNLKYAKMAAQDDGGGQATMTAIKHNILIHWALQPPMLQMLRPIDVLISTIHTVFPPVFGVAGHEYFGNWQAVKREDLVGPGNTPVEEKLKKGLRNLRFFLHPDKLPRDLTDEQTFMCKMLWDITSDAWDDFQKHKEELDWVRN